MLDGSFGSDDYLMGWEWGDSFELSGSAEDTSRSHADMINSKMPKDFVKRIVDMINDGVRTPIAGSIDHWMK
jgi:hypothetical protein